MKISIGLGWLLTPLRYRRYRRFAAGGLFVMGAFSFVTFDLAPRDGHLAASIIPLSGERGADFDFMNTSEHTISDLHARGAIYDFHGQLIAGEEFVPRGMTVEGHGGKSGRLGTDDFPPDQAAFGYFCGHFKGSYLFDRVRDVWILGGSHLDRGREFGQIHYERSRHFLRTPDCTAPEDLTEHAAAAGWEFDLYFERFEEAGFIPSPEN